jgi:hypothetical protein
VSQYSSLPWPSNSWPTMPFLHYMSTTLIGEKARHSSME